jgi:hypothetical protein
MASLDSVLQCSMGSASMQLLDYQVRYEPIINAAAGLLTGRIGTRLTVSGEGYIEETGTAAGDLAALWAVKAAFRDGQNFTITGPGGVAVSILAARCTAGGPHITLEIANGREVRFTLTAEQGVVTGGIGSGQDLPVPPTAEDGSDDLTPFPFKVTVRPGGNRTISASGELRGPNTLNRFYLGVVGSFKAEYPPASWAHGYEYEMAEGQDVLKYSLTAEEHVGGLPVAGSLVAVEGEGTRRTEIDEQNRVTETWDFSLALGAGDPQGMIDLLRRGVRGTILRESAQVTLIKERRLIMSITTTRAADGSFLVSWMQRFSILKEKETYEEKRYPGCTPILVRKPTAMARVTQSGEAVGVDQWPQPPEPVLPESMLEQPEVSHEWSSRSERKTTWNYVMAFGAEDQGRVTTELLGMPQEANG